MFYFFDFAMKLHKPELITYVNENCLAIVEDKLIFNNDETLSYPKDKIFNLVVGSIAMIK